MARNYWWAIGNVQALLQYSFYITKISIKFIKYICEHRERHHVKVMSSISNGNQGLFLKEHNQLNTILPEHLIIHDCVFLMLLIQAAKGESFIVFFCTLTVKTLQSWIRPTVPPACSLNAKLSYATWHLVLHSSCSLTLLAEKLSSLWTKCKSVKLYLEHSLWGFLMWHQN